MLSRTESGLLLFIMCDSCDSVCAGVLNGHQLPVMASSSARPGSQGPLGI